MTPADAEAAAPDAGREADQPHRPQNLWVATLGAVGVVYGDIGTSPLYAMREALHAAGRDGLDRDDVLGVISLLVWTLILLVAVKYVILILRADNKGEGGTLSLVALVQEGLGHRPGWLLALGVLGISLFFGDAIITPAMSVLSAVEGMSLVTPAFTPFVVPATLGIIVGLFLFQSQGTQTVSILFGPVMTVWFLVMAGLGLWHIGDDPSILAALNPAHAAGFLAENGLASLIVLGSVFLAVTGGEALYADMGHFGRRPIRLAWGVLVFPALTLSYLGQGALVLADREAADNPFFLMAPAWALPILVALATAATVIASQAVISGAFSMMRQATRMGLLPRLEITHTSEAQEGQVYLPGVNAILAVGVIVLVVAFGSSSDLAAAYGIAVSGDMVITSILAFVLFWRAWRWPLAGALLVMAPILALETLFLGANALKVLDGGYVPLLIAGAMGFLIWTWVRGTTHVQALSRRGGTSMQGLIETITRSGRLTTVPGTAVFLTSDPDSAPAALLHNVKHNHVLHERNLIVTVVVANRPYVPESERVRLRPLAPRFTGVDMTFGYMEEPNVPRALMIARRMGERFDIMATSFFVNRRTFRSSRAQGLPGWQERLFIAMTRSAADVTSFYRLPTNRVVEMGQQMNI